MQGSCLEHETETYDGADAREDIGVIVYKELLAEDGRLALLLRVTSTSRHPFCTGLSELGRPDSTQGKTLHNVVRKGADAEFVGND